MRHVVFSLLLIFTLTSSVHAEVREASETSFRFLGRGIENKRSGDVLTLACSNDSCTQAQFVFFGHDLKAYWVGEPLNLTNEKDFKKLLKKYHRAGLKDRRFATFVTATILGFATLGLAANGYFAGVVISEGLGNILGFSYFPSVYALSQYAANSFDVITPTATLVRGGPNVESITDETGWNWAEKKPKKVGRHYFGGFIHGISVEDFRVLAKKYDKLESLCNN